MRQTRLFGHSSGQPGPALALALLCALAGCLNPRPEDYPSDRDSADIDTSAPADPSRQGPGFNGSSAGESEPNAATPADPAPESPARPAAPPSSLVPEEPADAGADAGDNAAGDAGSSDAGAPVLAD